MAIDDKAIRLLGDGNVHVLFCTDGVITARVRGDSGVYDIGWTRSTGWRCTCPCPRRCSHVEAVSTITMRAPRRGDATNELSDSATGIHRHGGPVEVVDR